MLKLVPDPTFSASIKLTIPGQETPGVVMFEFRHRTIEALQSWYDDNKGKPRADALDLLIAGWSEVQDSDGKPVDYSKTALAALLDNYPASNGEILDAYLRELTASRIKN